MSRGQFFSIKIVTDVVVMTAEHVTNSDHFYEKIDAGRNTERQTKTNIQTHTYTNTESTLDRTIYTRDRRERK